MATCPPLIRGGPLCTAICPPLIRGGTTHVQVELHALCILMLHLNVAMLHVAMTYANSVLCSEIFSQKAIAEAMFTW